jgi:hypothetical protein
VAPRRFALRGRRARGYESREPLRTFSLALPSRGDRAVWSRAEALDAIGRLRCHHVGDGVEVPAQTCALRRVSRASPVRTAVRDFTRDEEAPSGTPIRGQSQATTRCCGQNRGGEHRGNAETMTLAGKVVICQHVSGGAPSLAPEMILSHEDQFFAKSVCSVMPPHA